MNEYPVTGSSRARIQVSWLLSLSYWACTSYFWPQLVEFLSKDNQETFLALWALVYPNPSPQQFTTQKSKASKIKYWEEHTGKYNLPWWYIKDIWYFSALWKAYLNILAHAPYVRQDEARTHIVKVPGAVDAHFIFTWWNVLSGAFGKRLSIGVSLDDFFFFFFKEW